MARPLSWQQRLLALRDAARSLAFLHRKEVVHRDVKPRNFLYSLRRRTGVLVDFGLTQARDEWEPALREQGLAQGKLGMELGAEMQVHMGHEHFSALLAGIPDAKVVDGSATVWKVRSIKSPAEIEHMRTHIQTSCAHD